MKSLRAHRRVRVAAAVVVAAAVAVAVVLPAGSVLAHVTVNPREATAGSYAKLAFRVPNERDAAATTKLEVAFPMEHPFASVSVRPKPGWTYTVEKTKLATPVTAHGDEITEAVSRITWTGGAVKPGEFEEFEVSVGRLPQGVDSITFKALQTYSDGEVVRWIEEATPGGEEPDRPAPVLDLTKAEESSGTTPPDEPASASDAASQGGELAGDDMDGIASKSDVDNARVFGILGMVFGLLGFVSAMAARRRGGSPARGEPAKGETAES